MLSFIESSTIVRSSVQAIDNVYKILFVRHDNNSYSFPLFIMFAFEDYK